MNMIPLITNSMMDEWVEEFIAENEIDDNLQAAILDLESTQEIDPNELGDDDQDQKLSDSSDIYLLKNQTFRWEFNSVLKTRKEYRTSIIFGRNKSDLNISNRRNCIEKPDVLKALEKRFGRTLPLTLGYTPALSLQRRTLHSLSDYTLFIKANPKDDFYKQIRNAVIDPILCVELKLDHVEELIEIHLGDDDFPDLKPFKRAFSRLVNRKLKKSENVEGTISVKLRGEQNKLSGTYEEYSLGDMLLKDKLDPDCTLVGGNGKEMKCHQLILKLHSPVFRKTFESGMKESTGKLVLGSLKEEAMEPFLKFLYKWDVEEPIRNFSIALNLLRVGHMYEVKDLEEAMVQVFKNRWNSCDHSHWNRSSSLQEVIELYTFANNIGGAYVSVQQTCVKILKSRLDELNGAEWFDEIFRTDPALAKKLCLAFGKQ